MNKISNVDRRAQQTTDRKNRKKQIQATIIDILRERREESESMKHDQEDIKEERKKMMLAF